MRRSTQGAHRAQTTTGAVALIQRFASAANLNFYVHALVLDGVYRTTGEGVTAFHPAPALTGGELQTLLGKSSTRVLRLLTRARHLVEEEDLTYVPAAHGILAPENLLAPLQATSCKYRIVFGPWAGRKVLSWRHAARRAAPMSHQLCANAHGFNLHTGVRYATEQRHVALRGAHLFPQHETSDTGRVSPLTCGRYREAHFYAAARVS